MIALVDCNNFFVSCEKAFCPDLEGKPVIVLSSNDGCVVSRSNEAKLLGIPMGVPLFKVKDIISRHRVHVFSSNFQLYADFSRRVMRSLEQLSERIEVYSVDEAFIKCDQLELGRTIRSSLKQWTSIPASIGISHTKTLAKIAGFIAKKYAEFGGVCMLKSEREIDSALYQTPIDEVWGVGRSLTRAFIDRGIKTALDLKNVDSLWLNKVYGATVSRTVDELRGIECISLREQQKPRQSVISTRSFGRKVTTLRELSEAISLHVSKAAATLREEELIASTITIMVRANRFTADYYRSNHTIAIPYPTNDTTEIIKVAEKGLAEIFRAGIRYAKCGVCLHNLFSSRLFQYPLFAQPKTDKILPVVDKINSRYGRNTVNFAACGIAQNWRAKSAKRSPGYTTRWTEIPRV